MRFIARRGLRAIAVLLIVSFAIFAALRLAPGDPITLFTGPFASEEQREQTREDFGLDESLWTQYGAYMRQLAQGDLGRSIFYRKDVADVIGDAIGPSVILGVTGLVLSYLIAVPLGILAATRQNRPVDHVIRAGSVLGMAIPNFWLGLMLALIFGVYLGVLPVSGYGGITHLILPAIAVAVEGAAVSTRLVRSSMVETYRDDFVRTLRAQGLRERSIRYVHCLRNALLPSITFFGLRLGWLLAGQVIIEYVFNWPGLGRLLIDSILARDYPLVQAVTLLFAGTVVVGNFVADVMYTIADPRIRRTT